MWSIPFGAGVALFADDLLTRVLDPKWGAGVELLRLTALALAFHQIGFNWTAFYRARGETRPMAVYGAVGLAGILGIVIPALLLWELEGLGWGIVVAEIAFLMVRRHYLRRLFDGFSFLRHALRATLPTLVPVGVVLGMRALEGGERTLAIAGVEALVYVAVLAVITWRFESRLVREMAGYLRGRP
jgi:O-antigen/teichoic acid export membrane protein